MWHGLGALTNKKINCDPPVPADFDQIAPKNGKQIWNHIQKNAKSRFGSRLEADRNQICKQIWTGSRLEADRNQIGSRPEPDRNPIGT